MPKGERRRTRPDFHRERQLLRAGSALVVGIDEAGIGPWAGPVVAAAVQLDPANLPSAIDDSKRLAARRREIAFDAILKLAKVGVGIAEVERIDRDNVLRASQWAMVQAVVALGARPDLALVDGRNVPDLGCPVEAIVDGDAKILSIAAASIVANVTRDRIMVALAATYPGYGFEKHKGYGTSEHRAAIAKLGLTPIHRKSFLPVQQALARAAETIADPPLTHVELKSE